MSELYEKLKKYSKEEICPMHMPGHKRSEGMFSDFDITEIDGFDNLANPRGVIKKLQDEWAEVYGVDGAYISVNGSTGAILSAICGICKRGDKVIMARNCHKSVYNAAELMELDCVYIFPEYDESGIAEGIDRETAKKAIEENTDASLLIITSPTYEGVLSDISGICEIAHERNIPVFVDCAHGAQLEFMGMGNPVRQGADIACVSLHKTLPSMTQTALLLLRGKRIDFRKIKETLNIFQTSSPSYVLMASVSECLEYVKSGKDKFLAYEKRLDEFYDEIKGLENLEIIKTDDRGKVVISALKSDISGNALMERLRRDFKIELEMAYHTYALAMTSVCDTDESFKRLSDALFEIDREIGAGTGKAMSYPKPRKSKSKSNAETEFVSIEDIKNRVCADYIWAYPPGVPIIVPGEIFDKDTASYLENLKDTELFGTKGSDNRKILVSKI